MKLGPREELYLVIQTLGKLMVKAAEEDGYFEKYNDSYVDVDYTEDKIILTVEFYNKEEEE